MKDTSIWWIRRDLRLADNPALDAALKNAHQVIPVFVLDPALLASAYVGDKRLAFLYSCLFELDANLRKHGSRLIVRQGSVVDALNQLMAESQALRIFAEPDYSPYAVHRDKAASQHLPIQWSGSPTVHPPLKFIKANGKPYTIFTPFSRAWKALPLLDAKVIYNQPHRIYTPDHIYSLPIPSRPDLQAENLFPPGEQEAKRRLTSFVTGQDAPIYLYASRRDRPDLVGTSGLSPYIRFGLISARQVVLSAYAAINDSKDADAHNSAESWLNELIWREFYVNILYHFPMVRCQNFRHHGINWHNDPGEFDAWCEGYTGYPLIDAAMRQLIQTGWMHNRLRMVVASFFVKDLLIDWKWGERWFMQHLIDGDPASNNGGWQWSAGTGTDAAPYFRVFNPTVQSSRYDPQGHYIRRWIPELLDVPDEYIHYPWKMTENLQRTIGCIIGKDYPAPIIDHQWARERALHVYRQVK